MQKTKKRNKALYILERVLAYTFIIIVAIMIINQI